MLWYRCSRENKPTVTLNEVSIHCLTCTECNVISPRNNSHTPKIIWCESLCWDQLTSENTWFPLCFYMARCVKHTPFAQVSNSEHMSSSYISMPQGFRINKEGSLPRARGKSSRSPAAGGVSLPAVTCCCVFFCCRSVWTRVATPPRAPSRETRCAPTDSAATTVRCVVADPIDVASLCPG